MPFRYAEPLAAFPDSATFQAAAVARFDRYSYAIQTVVINQPFDAGLGANVWQALGYGPNESVNASIDVIGQEPVIDTNGAASTLNPDATNVTAG